MTRSRSIALGGFCGLAWAAALRGWMAQLAAGEYPVSWLTFLLFLLPGTAVGMLLGGAAYVRASGGRPPRRLIFAPVLLATGLVLLTFMGAMAGPVTSARGAWLCLSGLSLILLLCLASALPFAAPTRVSPVVVGGLSGLAWAGALRAFMAEIAGPASEVHWVNTFLFVLLPGVLAGALLGWAWQLQRTGGRPRLWLLSLSPLLFAAVLFSNPLDIGSLLDDGIGGGALGVPLIGILGGYAASGRSSAVRRGMAGAIFLAGLGVWAMTASDVGGPEFALTTPHGLWATLLYWSLLISMALAVSVPLRTAVPERPAPATVDGALAG
jgi:hypothetical protein